MHHHGAHLALSHPRAPQPVPAVRGRPLASVAFYQRLLDREPLDAFPSYAAFALEGGHTLGLWASHRVSPPPPVSGHRSEVAFTVADDDAVRACTRTGRRWACPSSNHLSPKSSD